MILTLTTATGLVRLAAAQGLSGLMMGCRVLSPESRKETPQSQELARSIEALQSVIVNSQRQTINEVWPWIILLCVMVITTALLIRRWIIMHSYIHQKPVYEKHKQRSCPAMPM